MIGAYADMVSRSDATPAIAGYLAKGHAPRSNRTAADLGQTEVFAHSRNDVLSASGAAIAARSVAIAALRPACISGYAR